MARFKLTVCLSADAVKDTAAAATTGDDDDAMMMMIMITREVEPEVIP